MHKLNLCILILKNVFVRYMIYMQQNILLGVYDLCGIEVLQL